jgi:hypothetical protein
MDVPQFDPVIETEKKDRKASFPELGNPNATKMCKELFPIKKSNKKAAITEKVILFNKQ